MERKKRGKNMSTIKEYIKTLPRKQLDSSKVSLVLFDYDNGMYLYLFRINLNQDTCMMLTHPTLDCPYCELYSPKISQLDMYYNDFGIDKSNWAIGKNYRKIKSELES